MKIERKTFDSAGFKATDATQGIAEMIVSIFGNVDAGNEVVLPGFFAESIASRRSADGRPKAKGVWGHDWLTPIAKTIDAQELLPGDPRLPEPLQALGGLWVKAQFNLETQRGREAFSDLQGGFIDEFSIGYQVTQDKYQDGRRYLVKGEWFEWSPVLVGMNDATVLLATKSVEDKAAIPFKATAKAPEDETWSKPTLADFTEKAWGDLSDAEKRGIAAHFAWSAAMPPESYGDLKLPHHRPSDGAVVWAGVAACAARMSQSDIPAEDMPAVARHLAGHYEQFDKDIPQAMQDMMGTGGKGFKASDFTTAFQMAETEEALWDARWKIDRAFREAIDSILGDEALDTPSKLDMLSTSVAQYGQALVAWAARALAVSGGQLDANMMAAHIPNEFKGRPYAEHVEAVLAAVRHVVGRSRALAALRSQSKEGRTLSSANREKLAALLEALTSVAKEIDDLLAATAPPEKENGLGLGYLRRRLRSSGLALVCHTN